MNYYILTFVTCASILFFFWADGNMSAILQLIRTAFPTLKFIADAATGGEYESNNGIVLTEAKAITKLDHVNFREMTRVYVESIEYNDHRDAQLQEVSRNHSLKLFELRNSTISDKTQAGFHDFVIAYADAAELWNGSATKNAYCKLILHRTMNLTMTALPPNENETVTDYQTRIRITLTDISSGFVRFTDCAQELGEITNQAIEKSTSLTHRYQIHTEDQSNIVVALQQRWSWKSIAERYGFAAVLIGTPVICTPPGALVIGTSGWLLALYGALRDAKKTLDAKLTATRIEEIQRHLDIADLLCRTQLKFLNAKMEWAFKISQKTNKFLGLVSASSYIVANMEYYVEDVSRLAAELTEETNKIDRIAQASIRAEYLDKQLSRF